MVGRRATVLRLVAVGALLLALLVIVPVARAARTTTIDFSTAPAGATLDPFLFKHEGIVFTQGSFVGYVQGDDALIGPIAANVRGGFTNLSAQVAPASLGIATYTLAAYKHGGQRISEFGVSSITWAR